MRIVLNNIAKVGYADIDISNITVIAGYNGTGKSTVSKAVYSMMFPFCDMDKKIEYEFRKSLRYAMQDVSNYKIDYMVFNFLGEKLVNYYYLDEHLINRDEKIREDIYNTLHKFYNISHSSFSRINQYDDADGNTTVFDSTDLETITDEIFQKVKEVLSNDKSMYLHRILRLSVLNMFGNQVRNLKNSDDASIFLLDDYDKLIDEIDIMNNENDSVSSMKSSIIFSSGYKAVYIEPISIWNDINTGKMEHLLLYNNDVKEHYGNNLANLLRKDRSVEEAMSAEEYADRVKKMSGLNEILESVIGGKIINSEDGFEYRENGISKNIAIENLSSGLKCFLVIQRLIENGSLDRGDVLIIDEPEVNMHPKWQVIFAEILVLLNKDLGIKVLLNSHSPYFVRAIEVNAGKYDFADKVKYYLMEQQDNGSYASRDVSTCVDDIYKYMYEPLEYL